MTYTSVVIKDGTVLTEMDIISLGEKTVNEISKFSDNLLLKTREVDIVDSASVVKNVTKVLSRFNKVDFSKEKHGIFNPFGVFTPINKLIAKYQSIGNEIEKLSESVNLHEKQIKESVEIVNQFLAINSAHTDELVLLIDKINKEIKSLSSIESTEKTKMLETMLEQRKFDLQSSLELTYQAEAQLLIMQKSNFNLLRKFNSIFVVTLPVFKRSMVQAIELKKQKSAAEAIEALDSAANTLVLNNVKNTVEQSNKIAEMSGKFSVTPETIIESWEYLSVGIEEYKRIEEENANQRNLGLQKFEEFKTKFGGETLVEYLDKPNTDGVPSVRG